MEWWEYTILIVLMLMGGASTVLAFSPYAFNGIRFTPDYFWGAAQMWGRDKESKEPYLVFIFITVFWFTLSLRYIPTFKRWEAMDGEKVPVETSEG